MSGWFRASYDGECSICGCTIWEGDEARYVDGDLACDWCGEDDGE